MEHARISRNDLETWAGYLLDYALGGVQADDVIMIKGEHITWPLMSILQDKIFAAGGIADVNIVAPDNDRGKVWGLPSRALARKNKSPASPNGIASAMKR